MTPAELVAPQAWRMGARIGCDPGSKDTGVTASFGDQVLFAQVVSRSEAKRPPWDDRSLHELVETLEDAKNAVLEHARAVDWKVHRGDETRQVPKTVVLGVEIVTRPGGFARGAAQGERRWPDPWPLMITTALVATALMSHPELDVETVAPKGNGHSPYRCYPDQLITDGERRGRNYPDGPAGQGSTIRHCRSSWDAGNVGWMQYVSER